MVCRWSSRQRQQQLQVAASGGIYNDHFGTLTVSKSTLSGNQDGGIFNFQGTLTVVNTTLEGNSAEEGGGIYNFAGALTISNSTLSGNSVTDMGGEVANDSGTVETPEQHRCEHHFRWKLLRHHDLERL